MMKTVQWATLEATCEICGKTKTGIIGEFIKDGWILDRGGISLDDAKDCCSRKCYIRFMDILVQEDKERKVNLAKVRLEAIIRDFINYSDEGQYKLPKDNENILSLYRNIENKMHSYYTNDYGEENYDF